MMTGISTSRTCEIDGCSKPHVARGYCGNHYARFRRWGTPTGTPADFAKPTEEVFWQKVDRSGACWIWKGAGNSAGYGRFRPVSGVLVYAHRYAYELANGPIQEGMSIDHRCHNRMCVNPNHLRVVSHKQNAENQRGAQRNNAVGVRGVYWSVRNGKWHVQVKHWGRRYSGGYHRTIEEAAEAARQLRLSLFTHNDADRVDDPKEFRHAAGHVPGGSA